MDIITRALLRRFVRNHEDVQDPVVRNAYGYLEAWVGIAGNVVIAALNVTLGYVLNSMTLIAQSVHTAADVLTSVVVLVSFAVASRPPDERHPHGHGRIETLAALVIAVLLVLVGVEFAQRAYARFLSGAEVRGNVWMVLVMIAVAVAKEWIARFSIALGKAINSPALEADAWHSRSDAVASVLSAVSIGSAALGHTRVDAALGMAVSALIVWTGVKLGLSSGSVLMGERPDPEFARAVAEAVKSVEGVRDMHRFVVHDYGPTRVGSVHIQVEPEMSVRDSHDIARAVRRRLRDDFSIDCVVHVEPDGDHSGPQ